VPSYAGYHQQQQQISTNYNSAIDSNYHPSMATHQESEVTCSHNPSTTFSKKKHVKFSKNLTTTAFKKAPPKKWRPTTKATSTVQQIPATNTVGKTALAATSAPAESTYYYYYYYNTDTHQLPAMNDEQQQQVYNNIAGNYYYYAIDGTSDANYNDILIQPAGNTERYNGQGTWR
jgi:hypothetical protein